MDEACNQWLAQGVPCPAPLSKRPRSSNDRFDKTSLVADLKILEDDCVMGSINWSGKGYSKERRSQGPDREGLAQYSPVLKVLFKHCPHGLPSHVALKEVLSQMHKDYDIFTSTPDAQREANIAADIWRIMLAHTVQLSKLKENRTACPELNKLLDMLAHRGDNEQDNETLNKMFDDLEAQELGFGKSDETQETVPGEDEELGLGDMQMLADVQEVADNHNSPAIPDDDFGTQGDDEQDWLNDFDADEMDEEVKKMFAQARKRRGPAAELETPNHARPGTPGSGPFSRSPILPPEKVFRWPTITSPAPPPARSKDIIFCPTPWAMPWCEYLVSSRRRRRTSRRWTRRTRHPWETM
jgi:hypothetical protein